MEEMLTYERLKTLAMEEQHGSQGWAQASRAWADAAAAWEAAVYKTPTLSDVRARWTSAATSWASAAHAWVPGTDGTPLNGNLAWLSGSCHWAGVALRWALASLNWAAAAGAYPACAPESVPSAASALDWASAAEAWARPQNTREAPPLQWTTVATLFAVSGERTADLCAWASAGRGLPPLHNHPWSIEEMENRMYGRREDVEAAPVVSPHPPSPANSSVAVAEATQESMDSARENQAAWEDTTHSVAADETPVIPPQDQAGADATGTAAEKAHKASENKGGEASENKGGEVLNLKNEGVCSWGPRRRGEGPQGAREQGRRGVREQGRRGSEPEERQGVCSWGLRRRLQGRAMPSCRI